MRCRIVGLALAAALFAVGCLHREGPGPPEDVRRYAAADINCPAAGIEVAIRHDESLPRGGRFGVLAPYSALAAGCGAAAEYFYLCTPRGKSNHWQSRLWSCDWWFVRARRTSF